MRKQRARPAEEKLRWQCKLPYATPLQLLSPEHENWSGIHVGHHDECFGWSLHRLGAAAAFLHNCTMTVNAKGIHVLKRKWSPGTRVLPQTKLWASEVGPGQATDSSPFFHSKIFESAEDTRSRRFRLSKVVLRRRPPLRQKLRRRQRCSLWGTHWHLAESTEHARGHSGLIILLDVRTCQNPWHLYSTKEEARVQSTLLLGRDSRRKLLGS